MKYTQDEVNFLKENYPQKGKMYCANKLNRTEASIRKKCASLGVRLNKNSEFYKEFQKRAANSKIGKKRPEQAKVMKTLHKSGKLKRNAKSNKKIGESIKKLWEEEGHPRGMLGKKHSDKTKKAISKASKKRWNDPDFILKSEEYKQRKSNYMTERIKNGEMRSRYSRGKQGKRSDLKDLYVRSGWEANYARYLNWLKGRGEIYNWKYEADTFWFEDIKRGVRSYTPDFKIWETRDSEPYYVEVKGWMDEKSRTKLKRMAKYYPNVRVDLFDAEQYKALKQFSRLIPNWED
jgi:hypothetical protein